MKASNGRDSLERFSDQGGYFDVVIGPMLQQGHEGELCSWLKEMSLIRTSIGCPRPECEGRNLSWSPARIIDKYNWLCMTCSKKQSIRDNSFFLSIKCDLKICLQIILGWCQMFPSDFTASYLDIKEHIVKKVYERCGEVAESYVNLHRDDFILGGQGSVLIVDEFPNGYMTENIIDVSTTTRKRNNNFHTILCIAEANAVPPRMWLHMIRAIPIVNKAERNMRQCDMVEEALREIVQHTLPGSYIVANNKARCCNYEAIKELKQYAVMSVEYLEKFDEPGKTKLLNNLETIWQTGVEVCEEVQDSSNSKGQQIIATHLWRQRFGSSPSNAFHFMLNHIAETYRFT